LAHFFKAWLCRLHSDGWKRSSRLRLQTCLLLILSAISLTVQGLDFNKLKQHFLSAATPENMRLFNDWKALMTLSRKGLDSQNLKLVNDFFNQHIRFATDVQVWGKNDYWATPMQTISMRQGDCEDFAIAKYFSLSSLGVSEDKLRLMYVLATINQKYQQAHMVLAYYPSLNAEPLILDNLNHEILPATERPDLKPIYSLKRYNNESFKNDNDDAKARLNEAMRQHRISIWEDLVKRAQVEGFD
jgi:predicted transglutaminase-like cysteine proteinase